MRKGFWSVAAGFTGAALMATSVQAASWSYVGTSPFKNRDAAYPATNGILNRLVSGYHALGDVRRVKNHGLTVDASGNIYAAATRGANGGGLTIYKPGVSGYTQINIDLENTNLGNKNYNLPGGINKLVIAGDGKVYALQNYVEISFSPGKGVDPDHRILQVLPDGTVTVVFSAHGQKIALGGTAGDDDLIKGMDVGSDGNIYFIMGGQYSGFWKYRFFWRIVVGPSGTTVQAAPRVPTASPEAGDFNTRYEAFQWVGKDTSTGEDSFAVITDGSSGLAYLSSISWSQAKLDLSGNARTVPGWSRDGTLCTAYDTVNRRMYYGPRGGGFINGSGASCTRPTNVSQEGSCVTTIWRGNSGASALLHGNPTFNDLLAPINYHANLNDPGASGIGNGGPYWINTFAVNPTPIPTQRKAWYAFGGQIGNNAKCQDGDYLYTGQFGKIGNVYTVIPLFVGPNPGDEAPLVGDEGRPFDSLSTVLPAEVQDENQVVAVAFQGKKVYALAADLVNGKYHVFIANNPSSTCNVPKLDADGDGDIDMNDFGVFQGCYQVNPLPDSCRCVDVSNDGQVTDVDFAKFQNCVGTGGHGAGIPATPGCDQ